MLLLLLVLLVLCAGCIATLKADIKASYDPNATTYEVEEMGTKIK